MPTRNQGTASDSRRLIQSQALTLPVSLATSLQDYRSPLLADMETDLPKATQLDHAGVGLGTSYRSRAACGLRGARGCQTLAQDRGHLNLWWPEESPGVRPARLPSTPLRAVPCL